MGKFLKARNKKGQTAIEYLLLLTATVVIALIGFKTFIPQSRTMAGDFLNQAVRGIVGENAANDRGNVENYP